MGMAMEQRRMTPPRNSLITSVNGAALNPATAKMVIPAREIITPRTVPMTTPSSRVQRRRTKALALMRERQTERSRSIIICLPPKTRQASTTKNSPYLQTLLNKSVSNAGF